MTSSFSVWREKGHELQQLKHLNELRGSLVLAGLKSVRNKEEALEANLAYKNGLSKLVLMFAGEQKLMRDCNHADVEAEVLEGLCPTKDLVRLQIWSFTGSTYPGWMMLGSLNPDAPKHLHELDLYGCSRLASIPEDNEFFKCLRVLRIRSCTWDDLPANMESLKSLRKMDIVSCKKIKFLPTLPNSLEHIVISGNSFLTTSYKEEGSRNWEMVRDIRIREIYDDYSPQYQAHHQPAIER